MAAIAFTTSIWHLTCSIVATHRCNFLTSRRAQETQGDLSGVRLSCGQQRCGACSRNGHALDGVSVTLQCLQENSSEAVLVINENHRP